ncbi:DUF1294 domain-containing protein [Undibacterium flavidum]|uniref:DUF1294 domain-containing protein n=1 Tax=Undibacterium flavidum TaxID=2762297 RepID=A0ABR6Y8E3_9BURK|nr:DUF1294 domain-containing protein [Undibacterium flavidum]MBC3872892.1 DUF1294 domain-containing protein [Undibacterium flavidum]
MMFLIAYYGCVNLICFVLYGWDKAAARTKKSRISEKALHSWAFAGGAIGALCAQSFFRHKTQKTFFKWFSWFCLGLHVAVLLLVFSSTGMISGA